MKTTDQPSLAIVRRHVRLCNTPAYGREANNPVAPAARRPDPSILGVVELGSGPTVQTTPNPIYTKTIECCCKWVLGYLHASCEWHENLIKWAVLHLNILEADVRSGDVMNGYRFLDQASQTSR
jgi:hypothetical protein